MGRKLMTETLILLQWFPSVVNATPSRSFAESSGKNIGALWYCVLPKIKAFSFTFITHQLLVAFRHSLSPSSVWEKPKCKSLSKAGQLQEKWNMPWSRSRNDTEDPCMKPLLWTEKFHIKISPSLRPCASCSHPHWMRRRQGKRPHTIWSYS